MHFVTNLFPVTAVQKLLKLCCHSYDRSLLQRLAASNIRESPSACRSASECSHFPTPPSFWRCLAPIKNMMISQTVQESRVFTNAHTHTHRQTDRQTSINRHYWKQPTSVCYRCEGCKQCWPFKVIQGHRNWHQSTTTCTFLLVVKSNCRT